MKIKQLTLVLKLLSYYVKEAFKTFLLSAGVILETSERCLSCSTITPVQLLLLVVLICSFRKFFIKPGRIERAGLIQFNDLKAEAKNLGNVLRRVCSVLLTNCKICPILAFLGSFMEVPSLI